MKRYIIIFLTVLIMTGCNKKIRNYDSLADSLKSKFNNHILLKNEDINGIYNINTDLFNNVYIKVDNNAKDASMYAIFELGNDKDSCIEEVEYFIEKYKKSWVNNKKQEILINNGKKEEIENYIIYVIGKNPNEVIKTIKGFIK